MFTSLLRRLSWDSIRNRVGRVRRQRSQRRAARPRLVFEALEDRTLLSLFMVTNLDDAGAGSLRDAILDANANAGADVIDFAPKVKGTIGLSSGELAITDDLIIDGPGARKLRDHR